jgi:hypothetical protein
VVRKFFSQLGEIGEPGSGTDTVRWPWRERSL